MEKAMDQRHSKMFIMVFYVIAGPPSSFLSLQPWFGILWQPDVGPRKTDFWVVPTSLMRAEYAELEKMQWVEVINNGMNNFL